MRQTSDLLSSVLRMTAENLKRRGSDAGADGRLWAAIGAVRVVTGPRLLRATSVARELKKLGCDIDARRFAEQLLRTDPRVSMDQPELPSLWAPVAQAVLELLEQPDVSPDFGLCELWDSAGATNKQD